MDILHVIHGIAEHVNSLATGSAKHYEIKTSSTTKTFPKNAKISHYGYKGDEICSISDTDYKDVNFDGLSGKVKGGNLLLNKVTPGGLNLSSTNLGYTSDGGPGISTTQINNYYKDSGGKFINNKGIYKNVRVDLSSTVWTEANTICTGNIPVEINDSNNNKLHSGILGFKNEKLTNAQFQHYQSDNGAVNGYCKVDYTNAETLGTSFVRGSFEVSNFDTDNTLISKVTASLSNSLMISFNTQHIKNATFIITSFGTDKSPITYNLNKKVETGVIKSSVFNSATKKLLSEVETEYKNSVISSLTKKSYDNNGKLSLQFSSDYSKAIFNNDLRVVSSSVSTTVRNRDGDVITTVDADYDDKGNLVKKIKNIYKANKIIENVVTDYLNVVFGNNHKPISGYKSIITTSNGNSVTKKQIINNEQKAVIGNFIMKDQDIENLTLSIIQKSKNLVMEEANTTESPLAPKYIRRNDGTLIKKITTNFDSSGKIPQTQYIECYGTDGKTITKTYNVDLTKLKQNQDSGETSGNISVVSKLGGKVKESHT